ncbi:MAG: hypothetical protein ACLUSP_09140 [Christensenellales bacterium]
MSGDAISDIDLGAMVAAHLNSDNLVTVALTTVPDPRRYGWLGSTAINNVVRRKTFRRAVRAARKRRRVRGGQIGS